MKQQYTWGLMLNEYDLVLRGDLAVGVYCYRSTGRLTELHLVSYCPLERFHHVRIRWNGGSQWWVQDMMAGIEIQAVHLSLQAAYRFACGLLRLLHREECILAPPAPLWTAEDDERERERIENELANEHNAYMREEGYE